MYFIVVLSIIINLHISVMQATCNKTFLPQTKTTTTNKLTATNETYKNENDGNNVHYDNQLTIGQDGEITLNELDSLRLEYYKYKILSQLAITTDPDQFEPDLSNDLRIKLTSNTAFNDIKTKNDNGLANLRHKRSLDCSQVKSNKDACCLQSFYVNFTDIGWDKWILYPAGYNANYCRGECDLSHARYYHSTLLSKFSNLIGLCCSPKQMAPLRLLYIDADNKVHQKNVPDMIVESCDCA